MNPIVVVLGLLALGAPEAGPEHDVIWLKNGRKVEGVILAETPKDVTIQQIIKGRKGQTVGTASTKIKRGEILRIERMSAEAREKAREQSTAFGERRSRLAAGLARYEPRPVTLLGKRGLRSVGTHFEVHSTCDAEFVKEVTYYLDEVFSAYKESFGIRRNAGTRIRVYLLSGREEYRQFQKSKFGATFENPAFYHRGENFIAAYNMIRKEEEVAIRKKILELEGEIRDFKKTVTSYESRLRKEVKDVRRKIAAEAARAKRKIRADSGGNKAGRLAHVDAWMRKQLALVKKKEKEIEKDLKEHKKKADEAIKNNRKVITKNRRLCALRNRGMFEMLFHEGFHAFAVNFLWQRGQACGIPRWLDEGLAAYYEMSAVEVGQLIHGASHPAFLRLLKDARKNRKLLSLQEIIRGGADKFVVAHRSNAERSTLYYAQSWAIVHYMTGRVSRERLEGYVSAILAGKDGVEAFEKMMGCSILRARIDIEKHIDGLD